MASFTYAIPDDSVPHMTSVVTDSVLAGPQTLRSELVTAMTLMKRQIRTLRFTDHRIIPV